MLAFQHSSICKGIIVQLFLLASLSMGAQTLYGYNFTTGVDSTVWITLTNPDTIKTYDRNVVSPPVVGLDFPFGLLGTDMRFLHVYHMGQFVGNMIVFRDETFLYSWARDYPYPNISLGNTHAFANMVLCQTVGSPGNRTLVCEISSKQLYNSSGESRYQLQLDEGTCALRIVYGYNTSVLSNYLGDIGFTGTDGRYIVVNPQTHTAIAGGRPQNSAWPGDYRYYQFVPVCPYPAGIKISEVGESSAMVSWSPVVSARRYLVRYGNADSGYVTQSTADTSIYLFGLSPNTQCEVQVSAVCNYGDTSDVVSTKFSTLHPSCSNIPFTSLWMDFVECRIGFFEYPSVNVEIVDCGYDSISSRHTVHYDTSERDPRTNNLLRTIPVGHCSSVRLGNWKWGAQQESITYTLRVDTNDYDLLILRYAIVEENPNHNAEEQPYVVFSVSDSAGDLTDSCYYAVFVSGDSSGWNEILGQSHWEGEEGRVVWHDWDAFGISLTEFHGQKIRVAISNFDCQQGGHYGYVYFTLEGIMKHLASTACGTNVENTFRAPQGFNYRWYSANNPLDTLSTDDTLHVSSEGYYYCQASYQLAGRDCSFTMSTRAGPRYPVANFASSELDSCGAVRLFVNQSAVAIDANHTQLTSEQCERYLWRFSDGTVDSSLNTTHTFGNGTHTVTLLAMLANGACVDSVSQTFTVSIPRDTIYVVRCWGSPYLFGDRVIAEPGCYSCVEGCVEHTLFFSWYDRSPQTFLFDTICMGDTLYFGSNVCVDSGSFTQFYADFHGCDSIVNLQLSCMPTYSVVLSDTLPIGTQFIVGDTSFAVPGRYSVMKHTVYGCDSLVEVVLGCFVDKDTLVCSSSMPLMWDGQLFSAAGTRTCTYTSQAGTDSIVTYTVSVREQAVVQWTLDQNCDSGLCFIVEVGGGYRYGWLSSEAVEDVEEVVADSLYYICPQSRTLYYLQADYFDGLSCPAMDSFYLDPVDFVPVHVDFSVTPERPSFETSSITLTDQSQGILSRQWYVDGLLQPEDDAQIEIGIPLSSDSIKVCLVGYRAFCSQSLCKYIYLERWFIYFPNVFTPNRGTNSRFTAFGVGVAEFEMWVFDRRGLLLFHTHDMGQGWDGTSGGVPCRQEAYAYTCRYRFVKEKGYHTHTGTVLLLR